MLLKKELSWTFNYADPVHQLKFSSNMIEMKGNKLIEFNVVSCIIFSYKRHKANQVIRHLERGIIYKKYNLNLLYMIIKT